MSHSVWQNSRTFNCRLEKVDYDSKNWLCFSVHTNNEIFYKVVVLEEIWPSLQKKKWKRNVMRRIIQLKHASCIPWKKVPSSTYLEDISTPDLLLSLIWIFHAQIGNYCTLVFSQKMRLFIRFLKHFRMNKAWGLLDVVNSRVCGPPLEKLHCSKKKLHLLLNTMIGILQSGGMI